MGYQIYVVSIFSYIQQPYPSQTNLACLHMDSFASCTTSLNNVKKWTFSERDDLVCNFTAASTIMNEWPL